MHRARVSSAIVERAEHHKHGFETYGDSVWWAFVTLTTVGYGDLVPETRVGRVTAVFVMLTGVAMLGTVAASLASLFRAEDVAGEDAAEAEPASPGNAAAVTDGAAITSKNYGPCGPKWPRCAMSCVNAIRSRKS